MGGGREWGVKREGKERWGRNESTFGLKTNGGDNVSNPPSLKELGKPSLIWETEKKGRKKRGGVCFIDSRLEKKKIYLLGGKGRSKTFLQKMTSMLG